MLSVFEVNVLENVDWITAAFERFKIKFIIIVLRLWNKKIKKVRQFFYNKSELSALWYN